MSEITRYNYDSPFAVLDEIFGMNPFLTTIRQSPTSRGTTSNFLRANTYKQGENYVVEVAVPGVNKNNIDITVDSGTLTISSNTRGNTVNEGINYTTQEFAYTSFERSFRLPRNVSADEISASYNSGVLTLTVPTVSGETGRRVSID
mgnify:CR=1 FL=1